MNGASSHLKAKLGALREIVKRGVISVFWLLSGVWICGFRHAQLASRTRNFSYEELVPTGTLITSSGVGSAFPPLGVGELRNAQFTISERDGRHNCLIYSKEGRRLILDVPTDLGDGPWIAHIGSASKTSFGIIDQRKDLVLIHRRMDSQLIEVGALIPGPSHNFFHWLIESLPAVHLLTKSTLVGPDIPLIVPEGFLAFPNSLTALNLFRGNRRVIPIKSGFWYQANRLFTVDGPTIPGPRRMSSGITALSSTPPPPPIEDGYHQEFMKGYREELLKRLKIGPPMRKGSEKVYLARKTSGRRDFNRSEVESVLGDLGFQRVYPEDLPLKEIALLMQNAKFIVGPQGAQWANTIFCNSNVLALQFNGTMLSGSFANLASLVGYNLKFLLAGDPKINPETKAHDPGKASVTRGFYLDPRELRREISALA